MGRTFERELNSTQTLHLGRSIFWRSGASLLQPLDIVNTALKHCRMQNYVSFCLKIAPEGEKKFEKGSFL
jgi:hypothetical protein